MAKLDFPDASYSPWVAPNNVIYTYIGTSPNGYWEANTANAATNLTAVFVERTGSTMTGALKLDNAGNVALPDISFDGDVNSGIYSPGADSLAITTGGTQRVTVDSLGRVGIGTSSPDGELDVTGTGDANGGVLVVNDAGACGAQIKSPDPTILFYETDTTNTNYQLRLSSGNLLVQKQNDTLNGADTKVTIDSSGKVGIGTTSPSESLEVAGNGLKISGQTSGVTDEGITFDWDSGSNNGRIFSESAGSSNLLFYTTSSGSRVEKMRITSSGNVGIGTSSPNAKLDVGGQILLAEGNEIGWHDGTGTQAARIYASATDELRFERGSSALRSMTIDSSGNVGVGETSPDLKFHVKETINVAYSADNATDDANNLLKLENPSTTANAFAGMAFRTGSGADMYFGAIQQSANAGDFYFVNQNSPNKELMRITSAGNVGIGTSTPLGDLTISNGGAHGIELQPNISTNLNRITNYNRSNNSYVSFKLDGLDHQFCTSGSERMRILATGGLTFNGDTAQANALDDYEEGTWTPQYISTGINYTYGLQSGDYIKIGSLVIARYHIKVTTVTGSGSGIARINLPFTVRNSTNNGWTGSIGWHGGLTGFSAVPFNIALIRNTAEGYLHSVNPSTGEIGDMSSTSIGSGALIEGTLTFQV